MNNLFGISNAGTMVLILLISLIGCSGEDTSTGTSGQEKFSEETITETVRVVDGNGETHVIEKPVEHIIVEYIDNAELVRILDRENRIVGIAGYDYIFEKCVMQFPEIRKKPTVGLFWKFDYEAVLGLSPDLILTFGADTSEKREKLPGVDVFFPGLYYPDLQNPDESIFVRGVRALGRILDSEVRAEEYIKWYLDLADIIDSRTSKIPESERPQVFITSYPHTDLNTSTFSAYMEKDTLTQAMTLAGGRSISESIAGYKQGGYGIKVDIEWVLEKDPDIIILHAVDRVDLYGYETDDPLKIEEAMHQLISRPELAKLKAVNNKRIYLFNGHLRNDASGGIIAAAYMARIFHSDIFTDINPEDIHQEYINMQGLKYDLDRHGVFLFPPLVVEGDVLGIPNKYIEQFSDVKN